MKTRSWLSLITMTVLAGCAVGDPDLVDEVTGIPADAVPYSTDCATVEQQHDMDEDCHLHETFGSHGVGCASYFCCGTGGDGITQYVYCLSASSYTCGAYEYPDGQMRECLSTELE